MDTGPRPPGWWLASDGRWYPPELAGGPARVPDAFRATPTVQGETSGDRPGAPVPTEFVIGAPTVPAPVPVAAVSSPGPATPKRRTLVVGAGITLAAVVAAVIGLVATSGTSPNPPSGNAVLTSAETTMGTKTADLHMSLVMQVPGAGSVTATGSGAVDFADDAGQMTVRYAGVSQVGGMQLTEVFVGQTLYLSMPQVSQVIAGKSWVSEPLSASSSLTPGSTNPAAMLQMLTDEGNTVTPLGPSTVDGEAVHGFHVVINPTAFDQALSHSGLSPSAVQQATSMFGTGGVQLSVFIADDTHLVSRMTFSIHLTVQSVAVSAQATEDISDYGAAVSVTAPPADQVVSLQQFEQSAAAGAGAVPSGSGTS